MEPTPGSLVRQYRFIEKLGSGGMGDIYKAQDTRLNRFVAIKVLPPGKAGDPAMQRRFIQEAQAASALNHPNIVTIYDIISDDGALYIVMEHIAGQTLSELIPAGGLKISRVLRFATQMADALSVAHAAGIIHRDLKPANVMITHSGLVKILDFGLAKWTGNGASLGAPQAAAATVIGGAYSGDQPTLTEAPLTVEGSILGTLNYMSPEQAEGKRVDARADIFSFGAVLYEMATGRRAFDGDSTVAILSAVLRDAVTPLSVLIPDAPHELDHIIGQCLRKDPGVRWQAMRDVELALSELKRSSESTPQQNQPPVAPSAVAKLSGRALRKSAKTLLYASVGIALLAALGVGGWRWAVHRQSAIQSAAPIAASTAPTPSPAPAETPKPPDQAAEAPSASAVAPAVKNVQPNPQRGPGVKEPLQSSPAIAPQPAPTAAPSPVSTSNPAALDAAPKVPSESKPTAQLVTVKLNDAMPVRIVLKDDVAADAAEGQSVSFRVADSLQIGDTVVIAKGSAVTGEVAGEIEKKKFFGIGANNKLTFRLLFAESVDDEKIRVRAVAAPRPDNPGIRPFDTGKTPKSKAVAAPRGTEYVGYIDGDQTVSVHRQNN